MEKKGKITINLSYEGEHISVDSVEIDGKTLEKPTGNLVKNPPPGILKGIIDIGQILCLKQPDGTERRCVHMPNCDWYCY
jgi:hypothetical protein